MRRAKVEGEWIELPEGAEATCSLGDKEPLWDICGLMGLCETCRELENVAIAGCGRRYIAGWLYSKADEDQWHVTMPDGSQFWADEIETIDIDFRVDRGVRDD